MSNEQHNDALELPAENNLINLDSGARDTSLPREINARINLLESSLGEHQSALEQINLCVDEDLERLGENELDLAAKVSETYKRLGEIDNTYQSLSTISDNIDAEVKKLTIEISDQVDKSTTELERVDTRSSRRHADISTQQEQLATRVNELVGYSKQTQEQLEQSIRTNTEALLALEKQLVAEIQSLVDTTQQRDNAHETDFNAAAKAIEINRARILQMQAVDEALEKRSAALELSTTRLTQKAGDLRASVDMLDVRTDELSRVTEKLCDQADNHAGLISSLQKNVSHMAQNIVALAGMQEKHFRVFSGLIALIVVAIAGFYFYQLDTNRASAQQLTGLAQRDIAAGTEFTRLQDELKSLDSSLNNELAVLNNRLTGKITMLQGQLRELEDQAQSLDDRLDYVSPFSSFGGGSVIHGPQWLAAQPSESFVIQVASVSDSKSLYDITQRYSHYFKDDMAYYPVSTERGERYVLVSGSYVSNTDAASAMRRMPHYIEFQRPVIARLADLQQ